jgi:hypothetical protein
MTPTFLTAHIQRNAHYTAATWPRVDQQETLKFGWMYYHANATRYFAWESVVASWFRHPAGILLLFGLLVSQSGNSLLWPSSSLFCKYSETRFGILYLHLFQDSIFVALLAVLSRVFNMGRSCIIVNKKLKMWHLAIVNYFLKRLNEL